MEYDIIADEEALSKCTWCGRHITDDMEVFGAGAKLKPGVDLSEYEGHCINISLISDEIQRYHFNSSTIRQYFEM